MLYDKLSVVPPPGSPLHTVFLLVRLERSKTQLLEHRALIQSLVAINPNNTSNTIIEAYQTYADAMLPFLERAKDTEKDDAKKVLAEFVKRPARIDLMPLHQARAADAKRKAERVFKMRPVVANNNIRPPTKPHLPQPETHA